MSMQHLQTKNSLEKSKVKEGMFPTKALNVYDRNKSRCVSHVS